MTFDEVMICCKAKIPAHVIICRRDDSNNFNQVRYEKMTDFKSKNMLNYCPDQEVAVMLMEYFFL